MNINTSMTFCTGVDDSLKSSLAVVQSNTTEPSCKSPSPERLQYELLSIATPKCELVTLLS